MRVLLHVHDPQELSRITQLMADKGIATHAISPTRRGPWRWIVFVCLNSQYEDAVRLLRDESHVVSSSIDVDAFNRNAKTRNLRYIAYWSTVTLFLVVAAFVVVVWVAWRYQTPA
jgi:hypothetical protein